MRVFRDSLLALLVGFVVAYVAAVTPQASLPRTLLLGAFGTGMAALVLTGVESRDWILRKLRIEIRRLPARHVAVGFDKELGSRPTREGVRRQLAAIADATQLDALRDELRKWRPDGKAGELKALVHSEMPNLTVREAEQIWQFLWLIYQKPFTEVSLKPDESNSSGSCVGTIHLMPASDYRISRPCAAALMLRGTLEQMVTKVKNEAYADARIKPATGGQSGGTRDQLGALLTRGTALNRGLPGESSLAPWMVEFEAWIEETAGYIGEHVSSADSAIFRDISHSGLKVFPSAVNKEHNRSLGHLHGYLSNLRSILERLPVAMP